MSDLDFYAHVATRCDVLGVGVGAGPDAWEAAVGRDYFDDRGAGLLRRDYGLLEVSFSDEEGTPCFGISVQVHRLLHGLPVPSSLEGESGTYGAFAPRVRFVELRDTILALGRSVEPEDLAGDIHRYRVVESGARIFVVDDPDPYGDGDDGDAEADGDPDQVRLHRAGDVWALSVHRGWVGD
ncbi:hypothetical protein DSC45_02700 [Streptomyces sp. YIM 130001]|uniref:hypothetical protein n=1 Tax=Streptomyces sp. YIM 130001 TaxID=2259644 RepID=UPI000E648D9A|nr:hypothetical protein [Streptomyces sp. YIM 130001]RII20730.1 hypothetical protein DSC45_02700 [Streptomyces sp. YIM 130001]